MIETLVQFKNYAYNMDISYTVLWHEQFKISHIGTLWYCLCGYGDLLNVNYFITLRKIIKTTERDKHIKFIYSLSVQTGVTFWNDLHDVDVCKVLKFTEVIL